MTLVQELLARMTPEQAKAVKAALKRERKHKAALHNPLEQHRRRMERQWERRRGIPLDAVN